MHDFLMQQPIAEDKDDLIKRLDAAVEKSVNLSAFGINVDAYNPQAVSNAQPKSPKGATKQ